MSSRFVLVEFSGRKKKITFDVSGTSSNRKSLVDSLTQSAVADNDQHLIQQLHNSYVVLQQYDVELEEFVDVMDCDNIHNKAKVKALFLPLSKHAEEEWVDVASLSMVIEELRPLGIQETSEEELSLGLGQPEQPGINVGLGPLDLIEVPAVADLGLDGGQPVPKDIHKQTQDEANIVPTASLNRKLLHDLEPDDEHTNIVNEVFNDMDGNIFQDLHTKYLLDKYLIEQSLIILPVATSMGEEMAWVRKPTLELVQQHIFCQTIPFKKSLEQLLNNDDILRCVDEPRANGTAIKDLRDGYYFKNHPVFSNDPTALAIILYYDDVEVANPLGSKTKIHKLGLFYWMLGNIYPECRSTLTAINLLAIAKTKDIRKYGVSEVLSTFLDDLRVMESEEGLLLQIKGRPRRFRGSLLFFTGDTLASNYIGGFKEGVGFANRPCRTCMVRKNELSDAFYEQHFQLRDIISHQEQCGNMEEPGLSRQAKAFWSSFYGIVRSSPLNVLNFFDVTKCFPHDFMHIFAEGVLPMEITLLLRHCIFQKYFRLEDLNERITNFAYEHMITNKPSLIEAIHLENNLRQNAAQMMTLGYILPFLIGEFVPEDEENFVNFIRLVQIMNLCLAFEIETDDTIFLERMIEIHHTVFVQLYPEASVTPKFHYMIHFPEQIRQFGPLRHQWCIRFEAAHYHFTVLASVIKNFRNIPYSLAYRHQSLRCSQLMTLPGEPPRKILYSGDQIRPGSMMRIEAHHHAHIIGAFLNVPYEVEILVTSCIIVHGTTYRKGSVVLLACNDFEMPVFGKVVDVIAFGNIMYVLYKDLRTLFFEKKLNAYKVLPTNNHNMIGVSNLLHPYNLSAHIYDSSEYVILLYHRRSEFEG